MKILELYDPKLVYLRVFVKHSQVYHWTVLSESQFASKFVMFWVTALQLQNISKSR